MVNNNYYTGVSIGLNSKHLSLEALKALEEADLIVGHESLLQRLPPISALQMPIVGNIHDFFLSLDRKVSNKKISVIASGNGLFHGIFSQLCKAIPSDRLYLLPGISAYQSLCAKIKLEAKEIHWMSLHQSTEIPYSEILRHQQIGIYSNPKLSGPHIAQKLIVFNQDLSTRLATLGSNLDRPEEILITTSLAEIASQKTNGLDVLLLHKSENPKHYSPLQIGLEAEKYCKENNLISNKAVRLIALVHLKLRPGILWDLGAGSGSVGIEAAHLCPHLFVHSVEKNKDRISHIHANITKAHLNNIQVHWGNSIELISKLPVPSSIFIGGGGQDLVEILQHSWRALKSGGSLVATAVTLESQAILTEFNQRHPGNIELISYSQSKKAGPLTLLQANNPVMVFSYEKQ